MKVCCAKRPRLDGLMMAVGFTKLRGWWLVEIPMIFSQGFYM